MGPAQAPPPHGPARHAGAGKSLAAAVAAAHEAAGPGRLAKGAQHANGQPEWAACHDALAAIDDFASRHGRAAEWNLDDYEICQMPRRLSDEVGELDAAAQAQTMDPAARVDLVRLALPLPAPPESTPPA